MTSAIGAASAVTAQIAIAAPAVAVSAGASAAQGAAQPPAAAAVAPQAQQQAALNQLLTKYKYGQSHGAAASALSSLGRQILTEAKTLRLNVTLPRAPSSAGAPQTTAATATGQENGKVDVQA